MPPKSAAKKGRGGKATPKKGAAAKEDVPAMVSAAASLKVLCTAALDLRFGLLQLVKC